MAYASGGVFINYRGEDSHGYGALLYTELVRHFGDDRVFLDCESIPAGADFVAELLAGVRSSQVLLAVIGPRWLAATDDTDRRRIDDPDDWIRRELAEAFTAGVRVIPVLTDQAELAAATDLPADIAALSRCQYRRLRRREPTSDLARIVADLTELAGMLDVGRVSPTAEPFTLDVKVRNVDYIVFTDGDNIEDVPASGHTLQLVITGALPTPVLLTDLRVEVVSRSERSGLLARHAAEVPRRPFEVLLDARPPCVRALSGSDFPYEVQAHESEAFDLKVTTESGEVRWVLWLDWRSGQRSGSVQVDMGGQAFRTAGRHARLPSR